MDVTHKTYKCPYHAGAVLNTKIANAVPAWLKKRF